MLQDFVKKKSADYFKLVDFTDGKTSLRKIRESNLPAFITNFIECTLRTKEAPVLQSAFSEILNKAVIFNVNYIIKPKGTLLKFLFGDVETRPCEFIKERLAYFQFYGYYVSQIGDFISINSLDIVSVSQIEHIIDEVNKKLLEEVSDAATPDSERLNLVKLLYYFFVDLTDNNPINIQLPKQILSVFLADKGFNDIKTRVDNFFSEEIFIQEAIELMKPPKKRGRPKKIVPAAADKEAKESPEKPKTHIIDKDSSNKDLEKALEPEQKLPDETKIPDVKSIRQREVSIPEVEKKKLAVNEEIYSDDLLFASKFNEIAPAQEQVTDEEYKDKLLRELFGEQNLRKRIIKKIFSKSETSFNNTVKDILSSPKWDDAIPSIDNLFIVNRVNFYSEEAVKFVDVLHTHFTKPGPESKSIPPPAAKKQAR